MRTFTYRTVRLSLRPRGPWATPWHADTLFSALCWQWRALAGERALLDWLRRFREEDPVFVLSDAFPDGYFPAPIGVEFETTGNGKFKRPAWIPEEHFRLALDEPERKVPITSEPSPKIMEDGRLQAAVGRVSGTTAGDGALFETAFFALSADAPLAVYVRVGSERDQVIECVRMLASSGFGKKCASGFGAFDLEAATECEWLDHTEGATGFVALSHFVPARRDPPNGRWALRLKFPKFQGDRVRQVFKGSLLTLTPGSVFHEERSVRPYYGRVIPVPTEEFPSALHYGFCFPAPAKVSMEVTGE